MEYLRDGKVVTSFPDDLRIKVLVVRGFGFVGCGLVPPFDPAAIKFHTEWRDGTRTLPSKGTVVQTGKPDRALWCEDGCGGVWTYELSVESQNVPLNNKLVIRVDTEIGEHIAEYLGELGTTAFQDGSKIILSPSP